MDEYDEWYITYHYNTCIDCGRHTLDCVCCPHDYHASGVCRPDNVCPWCYDDYDDPVRPHLTADDCRGPYPWMWPSYTRPLATHVR